MSDTITRAFELPLHEAEPATAWNVIRECWSQATMFSNWCVHMLSCNDVVRMPGMATWKDLPKPPPINLYALAFGRDKVKKRRRDSKDQTPSPIVQAHYFDGDFWLGATGSAPSIIKKVQEKYADERYDVIWRHARSRPDYHHPQEWPVPGALWLSASLDSQGRPVVQVSLPSGVCRKPLHATLRLRGGPEFGRQMALFRQVVEGNLPRKQLVIRWQRCSSSCHRPTCRLSGVDGRVMIKMVADLPLKERPGDRTLVLLTDPNAFWVAELDGRPAWVLNADHVRRIQATHNLHLSRLQRMAQDAKAERRMSTAFNPCWPLQQQRAWAKLSQEEQMAARSNRAKKQQDRLEGWCEKDQKRLNSWTHESAAHLLGFAIRQRVGEVFYLDLDTGFIPSFPWHDLHGKLGDKLQASSIDFYSESSLKLSGDDSIVIDSDGVADIEPTTPEEDERWTRVCRLREMGTDRLRAARRRGKRSHPVVSAPCAISPT